MSVTLFLLVLTVVVSIMAFEKPELKSKLMMNAYAIKHQRQLYRLLTSGFIHGSWLHLGLNMFTLYFFGAFTESFFVIALGPFKGAVVFILFYLTSIIISDLPSVFKFGDSPYFNSLGASGAVSAIVLSGIIFDPLMDIGLLFIPIRIKGFIMGVAFILYSYFQADRMADNINHSAHLIGALYGVVFTAIASPTSLIVFVQEISDYIGSLIGF